MEKAIVTTVEEVDFAKIAREEAEEKQNLEQLDWSLCLLISVTNFGFEELIKQLEQAKRLNCTEAEYKIDKLLRDRYTFSYEAHRRENESDHSSADGSEER